MRLALISTTLLAALSVVASAQTSFSSTFDAPTYTAGTLAGQDGWTAGSSSTAVNVPAVSTAQALSSTQSTLLTYAGTGGTFTSVGHALAAGTSTGATPLLTASASIYVSSLAGADRYFGIGFGTAASATSGNVGIALGGNGLRGGAGSYAAYNDLTGGLLQARTTSDFIGRWINVSVVADRSLTTNNVTFTFSGLGTSGGAATESFTKSVAFASTSTIAQAQVFMDWSNTSAIQGTAYIDNASFSASSANAVPEPATLAALGLGAAALLRRRRK